MNAEEFQKLEAETRDLQKKCATPPWHRDAADDLHADCYGQMGRMLEVIRNFVVFERVVVEKTTPATIAHLK